MLTVKQIDAAKYENSPDRLADGNGLYIRICKGGAKTFQLRMTDNGKKRWITLGQYPQLSLREARMNSALKRAEILDPTKPQSEALNIVGLPDLHESGAAVPIFRDLAKTWYDRKILGLSNGKHIKQNWSTLVTYVFPHIGNMAVNEIKQRHLIAVFDPIWRTKHATAKRTLGRVQEVFELAKLHEYMEFNPADFKREVAFGRVIKTTRHQPSLDWSRAPNLWKWLLTHDVAEDLRQMMMIMVLTGKRTSEVRKMQWSELNWGQRIWTCPQEHMKMRNEHRVPISKQVEISFENLQLLGVSPKIVFARPRNKAGIIDENAARIQFQKFDPDITGHGMRSTFRTWLRKQKCYPLDLMETALSHEKSKIVQAYLRDDLLDERRPMMQDWADYVTGGSMPPRLIDHL